MTSLFLGALILVLASIAMLLALMPRTRAATGPAGRTERAVGLVRMLGLVMAAWAGTWVLLEPDPLDRGLGSSAVIAPMVFGLVVLAAVLLGEFVVRPRWADGPRTASLTPRRLVDQLPARLVRLVAALTVAGVLLCLYTLLTASADDMGRAGRSLLGVCPGGATSARGPYPGSFYVVPWFVGVASAMLLGWLACARITRRTLAGETAEADRQRRVSGTVVVSAVGLVVATPLVGIAFHAALTLWNHDCPPAGGRTLAVAALVLVVATFGSFLVFLVALVAPAPVAADPRNRWTRV